ncbi:MAG: hypothetical protein KBS77_03455 [Bacteroidales bacterium]|nr:hypothetical protein [Candidatus Colicola faecequi]
MKNHFLLLLLALALFASCSRRVEVDPLLDDYVNQLNQTNDSGLYDGFVAAACRNMMPGDSVYAREVQVGDFLETVWYYPTIADSAYNWTFLLSADKLNEHFRAIGADNDVFLPLYANGGLMLAPELLNVSLSARYWKKGVYRDMAREADGSFLFPHGAKACSIVLTYEYICSLSVPETLSEEWQDGDEYIIRTQQTFSVEDFKFHLLKMRHTYNICPEDGVELLFEPQQGAE